MGIAKGMGGLIVKPLAGAFDAFSLTAEGLILMFNFGEEHHGQKQRVPRVFYEEERFIKEYNADHSDIIQSFLRNKHIYLEDQLIDAFKYLNSRNK